MPACTRKRVIYKIEKSLNYISYDITGENTDFDFRVLISSRFRTGKIIVCSLGYRNKNHNFKKSSRKNVQETG